LVVGAEAKLPKFGLKTHQDKETHNVDAREVCAHKNAKLVKAMMTDFYHRYGFLVK